MYNSGNIEPMTYLVSFLANWLEKSTKESFVVGLYYSIIEKKSLLLCTNKEGQIVKTPFTENQVLKSKSRNSSERQFTRVTINQCSELFCSKIFDNHNKSEYNNIDIFYFQNAFSNKLDSLYLFRKEYDVKAKNGQTQLEMDDNTEYQSEIFNLSKQLYNDQVDYFKNFNLLKQHFDQKLNEIQLLHKEIEAMQQEAKRFKLDEASQFIKAFLIDKKVQKQFHFDDLAEAIILDADPANPEFKSGLRDAVQLSIILDDHKESISIRGNLINFDMKQGFLKDQQDEEVRLKKVEHYLNELEDAASKAKTNGDKITGDIVSSYCQPNPRTAASISDYNGRHVERIQKLMKDRPNDWQIIRNSFRPIKKLLVKK